MPSSPADRELIRRIRAGEQIAWQRCIADYEGRLQAFVFSRLGDRALAEDLVQDTFLGFLTALPNYDDATPVENFLFAIAAHKITDILRRQGRRPTLALNPVDGESSLKLAGRDRAASSIARSQEQRGGEADLLAQALQSLIAGWHERGEYERLKCAELLFVQGRANQDVAAELGITEQAVSNHKYFIVSKLKNAALAQSRVDVDFPALGLE